MNRPGMDNHTISVGEFLSPQPDDEIFATLEEAIAYARDEAAEDEHTAIAVWEGVELERVLLRGMELKQID